MKQRKTGCFVGMSTVDLLHYVDDFPTQNEKISSRNLSIYAGGPACNSSIAFAYFGNTSKLVTRIGASTFAQIAKVDITGNGVEIHDAAQEHMGYPNISSITVTSSSGDRCVVSSKGQFDSSVEFSFSLDDADILLLDGHNLDIALQLVKEAKEKSIPVVLDGGSWKSGLDEILPFIDYAICSESFRFPKLSVTCGYRDILMEFFSREVQNVAITRGGNAIIGLQDGDLFTIEIPQISVVDTLGAGDIFHGAFSHYILENGFQAALVNSARIASNSCQFSGPRKWMEESRKKGK